ncbi:hypothetical protein OG592_43235 (plasmid) [Streptomyces avidinii]|uniref:hypothetical protein n=1 Tax=Streptomyces avidinii TaxID=1895 RepID=UPI002F914CD0|nr:hypothetical protein OG592_43235 [Streptomyces avidinii]
MKSHEHQLRALTSSSPLTLEEQRERRDAAATLYEAVRAEGNILIVASGDLDDPRIKITLSNVPTWTPSGDLHEAQDAVGRLRAFFAQHGINAVIDEEVLFPMTITMAGAGDARQLTELITRPISLMDLAVDRLATAFDEAGIHSSRKGLMVLDTENAWRLWTVLTSDPTTSRLVPHAFDHHDAQVLGTQMLDVLSHICDCPVEFDVIPWCEDCNRPSLLSFVLSSHPDPYNRLAAHVEKRLPDTGPTMGGTP